MKGAFLFLQAAAAAALGLAAGVQVEFNKNFMAGNAQLGDKARAIEFMSLETSPLPHNLLLTMDGHYSPANHVACTVTNTEVKTDKKITVLLAISKCLNDSSIDMIETWVSKIKAENKDYFLQGDGGCIEFATTLIPGACEARSEKTKQGIDDNGKTTTTDAITPPATYPGQTTPEVLAAEEVLPGEVARIAAFSRFGRVLESPPQTSDIPIAVVSFVNNEKSFEVITQYERKFEITNTFNFQICQGGESCAGVFENCVFLQEDVQLFMYNPFIIRRTVECEDLKGGVPVSYLDKNKERQCFCVCPAGFEQVEAYGKLTCKEVKRDTCPCTWSTHPFGYQIYNTEKLGQCLFTRIATDWSVPVPFPYDNYVAYDRVNFNDPPGDYGKMGQNGPRVEVAVTPAYSPVYDYLDLFLGGYHGEEYPPTHAELIKLITTNEISPIYSPSAPFGNPETFRYTWRQYQSERTQKIDDLKFTSYGKYVLDLSAYDYSNDATCTGCVAIVDDFRPKASDKCPASFCDNTTSVCHGAEASTAELTAHNLQEADKRVQSVYTFQETAVNDACSGDNRCDDEIHQVKDFFEPDYSPKDDYKCGKKCFDKNEVVDAFFKADAAKVNPLVTINSYGKPVVSQDEKPVVSNQCTRCCSYDVALKERWTDYRCGCDYDVSHCDGDNDQQCSFQQCLVLYGDTLATVKAEIKPDVKKETENVLKELVQEGYQSYTQIHRALQCTEFGGKDGKCSFESSIADLIKTEATLNIGAYGKAEDYVFWRYRVRDIKDNKEAAEDGDDESGKWKLFDSEDKTKVTFKQPQTKITLEAWTQCGISRKFYFYVHLHVHSDVKVCDEFDNMWYQTTISNKPVEDAKALCAYPGSDFSELTFDYHHNVGLRYARDKIQMNITSIKCTLHYEGRDEVTILSSSRDSPEMVERYAIELVNQATTNRNTKVAVECKFTYEKYDKSETTQKCKKSFVFTDCNGPEIDIPEGECSYDKCKKDDAKAFQACKGNIVYATKDKTKMDTNGRKCCDGCEYAKTVCTPILDLPDPNKDLSRCVPQIDKPVYDQYGYGNYEYDYGYGYGEAVALMARGRAFVAHNAGAVSLLGVSAMVAVVALVVVRRRRSENAAKAEVAEDAYYPLLH